MSLAAMQPEVILVEDQPSVEAVKLAYEEWIAELESVLFTLDDCDLECDGLSFAIAHVLKVKQVPHRIMAGYVISTSGQEVVAPHYWVELAGGWRIDYRLRMWLGDQDDVPHGILSMEDDCGYVYTGKPVQPPEGLNGELLSIVTDGKLSHVKVPDIGLSVQVRKQW